MSQHILLHHLKINYTFKNTGNKRKNHAFIWTCFFLAGQVLMNSKTEKSQKLRLQSEKSLSWLNIFTHGVSNGIESKKWVKI